MNLVIKPVGHDPKEIGREVERLIRQHKKEYNLKNDDRLFSWCVEPVGRKQFDEIKRYLDVYDIWKELKLNGPRRTWKKCVKEKLSHYKQKVALDRQSHYEINSEIDDDRKNALKIICNAERGIFPGKY